MDSMNRRKSKYGVNIYSFDTIDTIEKAYWLGFITGDGSIYKTSTLSLELNTNDQEHIYKFRSFMQSNHPIKPTKKNCMKITIGSKYITNTIKRYGIIQNKTYIINQAPKIDNIYISHYYRGILDSDGWITQRIGKRSIKIAYEIGFSSYSKDFLEELKMWLGCGGGFSYRTCHQLIIGGNNQFKKIIDILYKDSNPSIRLDRKYNKMLDAINYLKSYKRIRRK